MEPRSRDAAATRARIIDAARLLFATRGYHGTSIRRIAATAGVDHALVLRYFGNKERLLTTLLEDKALGFRATDELPRDPEAVIQAFEGIYTSSLTEGREVMQLLLRAEMDGVMPESLLEGREFPLASLADWLEQRGVVDSGVDPRALSMLLAAAGLGLAAAQPLLAAAVGWQDEDQDEVVARCVATATALVRTVLDERG